MSTKGRGEGVRDQLFIYFYFFLFFYFYLLLSDSCPKKQKLKSWKTKMSKKNRKSFWGEKKEQWSFAFDTYRWWIYCVHFQIFYCFLPVQHMSWTRVGVPPPNGQKNNKLRTMHVCVIMIGVLYFKTLNHSISWKKSC